MLRRVAGGNYRPPRTSLLLLRTLPVTLQVNAPLTSQRPLSTTRVLRAAEPPKTPLTPRTSPPPPPVTPKVQTSPVSPSSVPPVPPSTAPPLPPLPGPTPPKPKRRLFSARNIFALLLLTTLGYGGAVWYSFQSDNFHDFFTEYVPGSTYVIQTIQDYQFNQRYPGTSTIRKGERISDLARRGPHISAIEANRPEVMEKKKQDEKKEEKKQGKGEGKTEKEQKGPTIELLPKTSTPPVTSQQAKEKVQGEPAVKRDPAGSAPQGDSQNTQTEKDVKSSTDGPKEKKKAKPRPAEPKESTVKLPAPKSEEPAPAPTPTPEATRSPEDILKELGLADDPVIQDISKALGDLFRDYSATVKGDMSQAEYHDYLSKSRKRFAEHLPGLIETQREEGRLLRQQQEEYLNKLREEFEQAVVQERDRMASAFEDEYMKLQRRYAEQMNEEIDKVKELYEKKLDNQLLEQAIALKRRWAREIQTQVETERGGRLGKLAGLEKSLS